MKSLIQRILPNRKRWFFILLMFNVTIRLEAQLIPPLQNNLLNFNNSIAKAPVDNALKLGSEFTMMCWIYPTQNSPYGMVMGKPAVNGGVDPFMSYAIQWT